MEHSHVGDPHYVNLQLKRASNGVGVVEVRPARCPQNHPLVGRNVQVFYGVAPDGVRRRGWRCWQCSEVIWAIEPGEDPAKDSVAGEVFPVTL